MKGKEHMVIGTTATIVMAGGFLVTKTIDESIHIIPLILGGIIGSYMPDIDSTNSKAGQIFNKILALLVIGIILGYILGLTNQISTFTDFIKSNVKNNLDIVFVFVVIILGKLSPHRMFTHKWFGTFLFCLSIYNLKNIYFTIGFTMGYILHIICDKFSTKGKKFKFFEFKLPFKNSKNKFSINW